MRVELDRGLTFFNRVITLLLYFNSHMASYSQLIAEYGKQNIFARKTPPQLVENYTSYPKEAEKIMDVGQ